MKIKTSKLKLLRVATGKTQAELARELGVSQPLISAFERGYLVPGKDLKEKIAKVFEKPKDSIFSSKR